jgi:iron complex outermembrane receptor protein
LIGDTLLYVPGDTIPVVHHPVVPIESRFIKYLLPVGYKSNYSLYVPDSISLRQNPNGTVADLLAASGAGFVKVGAPGALSTSSIRGTDAAHLPVFWSGVPVTSVMLGVSDLSLFPHAVLGNWSLTLGGSSLDVGGGGLGGALRIGETSNDRWFIYSHQHFSAVAEMGSFGTWRGGAVADFSNGKHYGKVAVFGSTSQNNYPFMNTALAQPTQQRLANAATEQMVASEEFQTKALRKCRLVVKSWYQRANRQLPVPMTSAPSGEFQQDESFRVSVGLNGGNRRMGWSVSALHLRDRLRYVHPLAGYDEPSLQNTYAVVGGLGTEMEWHAWRFIHGLNLRAMHATAQTPSYGERISQPSISVAYYGTMVYDQKLSINLCVREEKIEQFWSPLLASVGAGLPLVNIKKLGSLQVKSNLTRNYRFPTLNMRYWNPGGNPELLPEVSHSAEAGLKLGSLIRANEGRLTKDDLFNLSVVGYISHVSNWIQWVPGPSGIWSPHNLKAVRSQGIESTFTLDQVVRKWNLEASLSHTLTDARTVQSSHNNDPSLGKQLFYVPTHLAYAGFMCRRNRTFLQVQQQFTGVRYTTPDNSASLPWFTLTHVSVGHTFRFQKKTAPNEEAAGVHDIALQLSVNNLFNTQYQVISWRPMPGRSFGFVLRYDFSHGLDL